jgi:hypothetical protein
MVIGAMIGATFQQSIGLAQGKLNVLGETVSKLSAERARFKPLEAAHADLDKARAKLTEASRAVLELKKSMGENPPQALKDALDKAGIQVERKRNAANR